MVTAESETPAMSAEFAGAIATRNPLRYASYCYDAASGLYYLQRRYYDPLTRAFLARDPLKADGDESPYQYCAGNPVTLVDPSGLFVTASGEPDDSERYVPQKAKSNGSSTQTTDAGDDGEGPGHATSPKQLHIARPDLALPPTCSYNPQLGPSAYPPGWLWLEADYRKHPDVYWNVVILLIARRPARAGEAGTVPRYGAPEAAPKIGGPQTGWRLGDPPGIPTKSGRPPSWSTYRYRYWRNEAARPSIEHWSSPNIERMNTGRAPQRYNPMKPGWESMELSHEPIPRRWGGTDVVPRWPSDHAAVDPFRRLGYRW